MRIKVCLVLMSMSQIQQVLQPWYTLQVYDTKVQEKITVDVSSVFMNNSGKLNFPNFWTSIIKKQSFFETQLGLEFILIITETIGMQIAALSVEICSTNSNYELDKNNNKKSVINLDKTDRLFK